MKKSTKYLILMLLSFILLIISILSSAIKLDLEKKSRKVTYVSLVTALSVAKG